MSFPNILSCLLWFTPLFAWHAYATDAPFWSRIRLHSTFLIKQDSYKVQISGMHPSNQDGELELNGHATDDSIVQSYRIRWYHAPSIHFDRDKHSGDLLQNGYDPKQISVFTGNGMTLCGQLFLSMDFRQLRIGAGAGLKYSFLKKMVAQLDKNSQLGGGANPNGQKESLNYIPPYSYYFTWNPLFLLGFKIVENQSKKYSLFIDSTWTPSIFSFSELGKRYHWVYWRNFDLGSTWEREISRYLHWSLRLAYGFCFNNEITENALPTISNYMLIVGHHIGGMVCQVGMRIRIPPLNKCPIAGCTTRLDHKHGGKRYRGDSFFIPYPA